MSGAELSVPPDLPPPSALPGDWRRLTAPFPAWHGRGGVEDWNTVALAVAQTHGSLVAFWGREDEAEAVVAAAFATAHGLLWLDMPLGAERAYPDLSGLFPCATRLQRAVADLQGFRATGAWDTRPWLDHGCWQGAGDPGAGDYAFVRVEGDGIHEIPVGPVHAGIIEPGHFRFSVVGERVLRLEERLGYTHRGIDRRFRDFAPDQGHRLAGRVSGDSTVAYAWAYCMALESVRGWDVPPRAQALRALLLERERVANHLGDLGGIANDAAFAVGLSQFGRLREDWLRLSAALFGHRLTMDLIVPGGVARDVRGADLRRIEHQCARVGAEVDILRRIFDDHAGLQDRFATTGRVPRDLAARLGVTGLVGRASGVAADLRADFPVAPYDRLAVTPAGAEEGDVAARVAVRFAETRESLRLIRALAASLPEGESIARTAPERDGLGVGWVEGWRGPVLVALSVADGRIADCHCHDPSWQNWPALEHAIIGDIVPDFPLINKSFNLSYAGHDR